MIILNQSLASNRPLIKMSQGPQSAKPAAGQGQPPGSNTWLLEGRVPGRGGSSFGKERVQWRLREQMLGLQVARNALACVSVSIFTY